MTSQVRSLAALLTEIEHRDGMVHVQVKRRGEAEPIASFTARTGVAGLAALARLAELGIDGLFGVKDTTVRRST